MTDQPTRPRLGHIVVLADEWRDGLQRVGKVTGTSSSGRRHVTWEDDTAGYVDLDALVVVGHEDDDEWKWWNE